MWSRIISWILAAITSVMNGFGMYTQEYKPFVANSEYTIQEEAVDYMQLRSWYISSYGGSGTCVVERKTGDVGALNKQGYCWIVRGGQHNPDAKIEFESGTVIVAPSRGKVTNSPNSSGNKIIVAWDSKDYTGYRMEIIDPEKWFCCMDSEPTSTGLYVHSNVDHRIELSQGDAICVAGPKTTMKLYRANAEGVLGECTTLRDFLLYTVEEGGNPDLNLSSGADKVQGDSNIGTSNQTADKVPGEDADAPVYSNTNAKWYTGKDSNGATRWWYGTDGKGTAGVDYAADQFAFVNNLWYHFDAGGWMDTGWNDGHFYVEATDIPDHPEGSMATNTIVRADNMSDKYVYVDNDGKVNMTAVPQQSTVLNVTYTLDGDYYVRSSENSSGGTDSGSGNNQGAQNSSTQGGSSGWVQSSNGEWSYYVSQGRLCTDDETHYTYGGYRCYKLPVSNGSSDTNWFLFDDNGELIVDERPFEGSGSEGGKWVYNNGDLGLLREGDTWEWNGDSGSVNSSQYMLRNDGSLWTP